MNTLLYIHGMGGGRDSRIPSILKEQLTDINVVARTYDFNPEIAESQISEWIKETCPALVVGESLGSIHALALKDMPCILVSPALNAPLYFGWLSFTSWLPGVTWFLDRKYKAREGDRQRVHFTFSNMVKWPKFRRYAIRRGSHQLYAFFGRHDHYMKSRIVDVNTFRKYFGDCFSMYDGTHFMENEYIYELLIPKIRLFFENGDL